MIEELEIEQGELDEARLADNRVKLNKLESVVGRMLSLQIETLKELQLREN